MKRNHIDVLISPINTFLEIYDASIDSSRTLLTSISQEVAAKKEQPTDLELLDEAIATVAEQKSSLMPLEVSAERTASPVVALLGNPSHPVCSPIMPKFCQQPVVLCGH